MKKLLLLGLVLLTHHALVFAEQMEERMNRAEAIQQAEENNKLCQLGSPSCIGGAALLGSAPQGRLPGAGAAGLPPLPNVPMTQQTSTQGVTGGVGAPPVEDENARPKAVGLSVVGGEKIVEVKHKDALVTLREGDTLGAWRVAKITDKGVIWEPAKAKSLASKVASSGASPVVKKKAAVGARKTTAKKTKREYDVFGSPAIASPVAIR